MDDTSVMAATYRARVSSDGEQSPEILRTASLQHRGPRLWFLSFSGPAEIVQVLHDWQNKPAQEAKRMKNE